MNALRCPVCGGSHVSPPTLVFFSHGPMKLAYERNAQGGFFSSAVEHYGPPVGCACLDCGHFMFFLTPDALQQLRQDLPTMHPVAP